MNVKLFWLRLCLGLFYSIIYKPYRLWVGKTKSVNLIHYTIILINRNITYILMDGFVWICLFKKKLYQFLELNLEQIYNKNYKYNKIIHNVLFYIVKLCVSAKGFQLPHYWRSRTFLDLSENWIRNWGKKKRAILFVCHLSVFLNMSVCQCLLRDNLFISMKWNWNFKHLPVTYSLNFAIQKLRSSPSLNSALRNLRECCRSAQVSLLIKRCDLKDWYHDRQCLFESNTWSSRK